MNDTTLRIYPYGDDDLYVFLDSTLLTSLSYSSFRRNFTLENALEIITLTLRLAKVPFKCETAVDVTPFLTEQLGEEPNSEGEFLEEYAQAHPGTVHEEIRAASSRFMEAGGTLHTFDPSFLSNNADLEEQEGAVLPKGEQEPRPGPG